MDLIPSLNRKGTEALICLRPYSQLTEHLDCDPACCSEGSLFAYSSLVSTHKSGVRSLRGLIMEPASPLAVHCIQPSWHSLPPLGEWGGKARWGVQDPRIKSHRSWLLTLILLYASLPQWEEQAFLTTFIHLKVFSHTLSFCLISSLPVG